MKIEKKSLLLSGKVKSLFSTNRPEWLIVEFRDDITAFDGKKHQKLANKGEINNKINAHIMQALKAAGVSTHFKKVLSPVESLVYCLNMIPVESVVRNITAGSLCRRLGISPGMALNPPLCELFLKNDKLHDPLINESHAINFGWATQEQLDQMRVLTLKINRILTDMFVEADLVLVDAKYEFGIGLDGNVYLGDEISPDSCRIWDKTTHESFDKDRFRKGLGGVVDGYYCIAKRLGCG